MSIAVMGIIILMLQNANSWGVFILDLFCMADKVASGDNSTGNLLNHKRNVIQLLS